MKLITINSNRVKGFKTLNKLPKSLEGLKLNKNIRVIDTGTLSNFRKFMNTTGKDHEREDERASSTKISSDNWSGSYDWDGYLEILDKGDEELMKQIKIDTKIAVNELQKKYKEVINNYRFDVTGQFFDVGLVLTGIPESWLEPEIDKEEIIKVDLVLNGAFHADFNKVTLSKNIARVLAMVKILENHNVLVSIKLISGNAKWDSKHREELLVLTHIKDYDEPINFSKITSLVNPAYHRRGVFKIIEMQADEVGGGYGKPTQYEGAIALLRSNEIDQLEHRLFHREEEK